MKNNHDMNQKARSVMIMQILSPEAGNFKIKKSRPFVPTCMASRTQVRREARS